METLTDTKLFRAKLRVMQLPLDWWLGVRGAFGFQTRCKFRTYTEAHDHYLKWIAAGFEPENLSISHFQDGPELWDIEWQINATRYRRQVEAGKLKPNPKVLQVLQEQITRLYEEAFILCDLRGWDFDHGVKECGLVRFVVKPTPGTHPQPLLGGETHPGLRPPLLGGETQSLNVPKDLSVGDHVVIDGRQGEVHGFVGSPAEGLSVWWDDGAHPETVWFRDVGLIDFDYDYEPPAYTDIRQRPPKRRNKPVEGVGDFSQIWEKDRPDAWLEEAG